MNLLYYRKLIYFKVEEHFFSKMGKYMKVSGIVIKKKV